MAQLGGFLAIVIGLVMLVGALRGTWFDVWRTILRGAIDNGSSGGGTGGYN